MYWKKTLLIEIGMFDSFFAITTEDKKYYSFKCCDIYDILCETYMANGVSKNLDHYWII